MSALDELEKILDQKVMAKVRQNPQALKEMVDLYYSDSDDEPTTQPAAAAARRSEPAAPAAAVSSSSFDMGSFEAMLDKKLGNLDERVKTAASAAVDERVKTAGEQLIQETTARTIRATDELQRIYRRHEKDFGEELDSSAFDTFLQEQLKAGTRYASMTKGYEDFTRDKRTAKEVETKVADGVREQLKTRATTQEVPGVTPASARSPMSVLLNRGKKTDDQGSTTSSRAGQALSERLASANLQ